MAARRRGGASAGADPALAPSAAPASKQREPSTAPVLVAAALVCVFCLCLWKDLLAAAAAPPWDEAAYRLGDQDELALLKRLAEQAAPTGDAVKSAGQRLPHEKLKLAPLEPPPPPPPSAPSPPPLTAEPPPQQAAYAQPEGGATITALTVDATSDENARLLWRRPTGADLATQGWHAEWDAELRRTAYLTSKTAAFCHVFHPKTGVFWVFQAEKSGRSIRNWQQGS